MSTYRRVLLHIGAMVYGLIVYQRPHIYFHAEGIARELMRK